MPDPDPSSVVPVAAHAAILVGVIMIPPNVSTGGKATATVLDVYVPQGPRDDAAARASFARRSDQAGARKDANDLGLDSEALKTVHEWVDRLRRLISMQDGTNLDAWTIDAVRLARMTDADTLVAALLFPPAPSAPAGA